MTIVTVSASYGAGGALVGPKLAERLGVPFLDRALPSEVAERLAIPLDEAVARDESIGGVLSRVAMRARADRPRVRRRDARPTRSTRRPSGARPRTIIREHAATGDAGRARPGRRAACCATTRAPLHVRLDGPREKRIEQAMRLGDGERAAVEQRLDETDRAREAYVRHFYHADPRDPALYHLTIDSTAIPLEAVVELIERAAVEPDPLASAAMRSACCRHSRCVAARAGRPPMRARRLDRVPPRRRRLADGAGRHRAAPGDERRALRVAVGGRRRHDRRRRRRRPCCTAGPPAGAELNVIPVAASARRGRADRDADPRAHLARRRARSPTTRRSTATSRRSWTDDRRGRPGADAGQDGLVAPSWIGNDRLLLSRDVSFDTEGADVQRCYALGGDTRRRGSATRAPSWATGFDAAASRDGTRVAVARRRRGRDAAATPTRVVLRLFSRDGVPLRARAGGGRHVRVREPVVLAGRVARGVGGERRHPRGRARRLRASPSAS